MIFIIMLQNAKKIADFFQAIRKFVQNIKIAPFFVGVILYYFFLLPHKLIIGILHLIIIYLFGKSLMCFIRFSPLSI